MLTAILLITVALIVWAYLRNKTSDSRTVHITTIKQTESYKKTIYNDQSSSRDRQGKFEQNSREETFRFPQGKHLPWAKSINDAVRWGFLTRLELEEFESHYDLEQLARGTQEKVRHWQSEKIKTYDYNEKRYKDLGRIRSHIRDTVNLSSRHCVKPRYKNEDVFTKYSKRGLCWYDKKSFWGAQCLALTRIRYISRNFSCFELGRNRDSFLGAPVDNLYPLVSGSDDAYFLYSLIYDFGYGPNLFSWQDERVEEETLKNKAASLYLVEIDVGKLTKGESYFVYKIGITTKTNIVGASATSRYGGKYKEHTKEIRRITYEDGRVAYMKEQIIIELANQGKAKKRQGMEFNIELLSDRDVQTLGVSEWIQEGKQGNAAIRLFDQIATAYS